MPYRDPNTPTESGWYLCEVPESMDRPARWACVEVIDYGGKLQALHFGSYRDLDFPDRWGRKVDMTEPIPDPGADDRTRSESGTQEAALSRG